MSFRLSERSRTRRRARVTSRATIRATNRMIRALTRPPTVMLAPATRTIWVSSREVMSTRAGATWRIPGIPLICSAALSSSTVPKR